jgi:TDP-4-keto-6-deoxy-D-glucose transaminase
VKVDPIPFNRPFTTGQEAALMADAVDRGHLSGDGFYTREASTLLTKITGVPHVLLTTSCTHALEMSAMLLDLGPGDEVIMPSFTFVSCANAFALRGARPVFVDIRRDTCNVDEELLEASINERTKAILVVHYAGVGCEMDVITGIADAHGIAVIEDTAHGLGATFHGRQLGTFGRLATLSFHETKNIQCGEGGALLLNDDRLVERAEVLREKGTNRSRFFRGQVDKYTWVDIGSSYLMSDLLAAFLTAQLESFEAIQTARSRIWDAYRSHLGDWAASAGFGMPAPPTHTAHPAHLFGVIAPDLATRTAFIEHMRHHDVGAVFHYVPLHSSPVGMRLAPGLCLPVTDHISERLVRLPLYAGLTDAELERVVDVATRFRP